MKKILFLLFALFNLNCFSQITIAEEEERPLLDLSNIDSNSGNRFITGGNRFIFKGNEFVNASDESKNYIVFEIQGKSSVELKSLLISSLSNIFTSPKDVVTSVGDNIIQVEGYASNVYSTRVGRDTYSKDILYTITIRLKEEKVRYDSPKIKTIYTEWPLGGVVPLDMKLPLGDLIEYQGERNALNDYFENLIKRINREILNADDW